MPVTAQLTQSQLDALVSFCYNCGAGYLRDLWVGRTTVEIAAHITSYEKSSGTALDDGVVRRGVELKLFNS